MFPTHTHTHASAFYLSRFDWHVKRKKIHLQIANNVQIKYCLKKKYLPIKVELTIKSENTIFLELNCIDICGKCIFLLCHFYDANNLTKQISNVLSTFILEDIFHFDCHFTNLSAILPIGCLKPGFVDWVQLLLHQLSWEEISWQFPSILLALFDLTTNKWPAEFLKILYLNYFFQFNGISYF